MNKLLNKKILKSEEKRRTLNDYFVLNGLALSIGIISGLGAIGFRYLIAFFHNLFFHQELSFYYDSSSYVSSPLGLFIFIAPMIGGLLVGLLTYYLAREAKGHGVPEVMSAVVANEGKIRPRVSIVKSFASALSIGSGASAGREGPIVQIGAGAGSTIGQYLKLSAQDTRTLLACGACGGIAATFNTPIGGVIFALELILIEFKTRSFIPLVVSSVFASLISRTFLRSNEPAFGMELSYSLVSPYELIFYLLLGLIAGIVGMIFIRSLYGTESFFDKLKIPDYIKPMIGGLSVGIIGLLCIWKFGHYFIFGVGYAATSDVLAGTIKSELLPLFALLAILIFLKIFATSLSLGSGGSGGVFAPSLFIGAMVGGAFGIVVNILYPSITAPYSAYALVGMAAVFAGTSRATLTAIIILFEMTLNYSIILPLMFACVVSDALSTVLSKETIYTKKIIKRGIRYPYEREADILEMLFVKDFMRTNVKTVNEEMSVGEVTGIILHTGLQVFPVLNKKDDLIGIVTYSDLIEPIEQNKLDVLVKDIDIKEMVTIYPDETLKRALKQVVLGDYDCLMVVDRNAPKKLVGLLSRSDIISAYRKEM